MLKQIGDNRWGAAKGKYVYVEVRCECGAIASRGIYESGEGMKMYTVAFVSNFEHGENCLKVQYSGSRAETEMFEKKLKKFWDGEL